MCHLLFLVQIRRLLYFAPSSRLPVELKAQKVINPILSAKVLSTVQIRINLDSFRQDFSLWVGKLSYFKKNRTAGLSQSIARNQNSRLYKLVNQGKVPLKRRQKCLVGWRQFVGDHSLGFLWSENKNVSVSRNRPMDNEWALKLWKRIRKHCMIIDADLNLYPHWYPHW